MTHGEPVMKVGAPLWKGRRFTGVDTGQGYGSCNKTEFG